MGHQDQGHECKGRVEACIVDGTVSLSVTECGGAQASVRIQFTDASRLGLDLQRVAAGAAHGMPGPAPLGVPTVRAVDGALVVMAGLVPVIALTHDCARELARAINAALVPARPELAS